MAACATTDECTPDGPGMTWMSRSDWGDDRPAEAKAASRLGPRVVARLLLLLRNRMSGAVLVGALAGQPGLGCVFPADLEPAGADAGPSSPPVILSAAPAEFTPPGPVVVSRAEGQMTLRARDIDIGDKLYVRLFVDYKQPPDFIARPPRIDCQEQDPGGGTMVRVILCETSSLCTDIDDDDTSNHALEAMISDRRFLPDGDPLAAGQEMFRAVDGTFRI